MAIVSEYKYLYLRKVINNKGDESGNIKRRIQEIHGVIAEIIAMAKADEVKHTDR